MKRRDFITTAAIAGIGFGATPARVAYADARSTRGVPRQILIGGGGFGTAFLRYMADLTGKTRPRLCYLPTASADGDSGIVRWFENCAPLNVIPFVQRSFITSYRMEQSWEGVLLSMDGIVVSGGNTLNQQAIWRAQGIDEVLRTAWNRGIVLGGSSAGSLCWFEEGTTDSRPKELTKIECLGFLRGSHSPHYDGEAERRPTYHRLIRTGVLKPGYACDNGSGIYFVDNEVKRVVKTRDDARVYYVSVKGGEVTETELPGDLIQ